MFITQKILEVICKFHWRVSKHPNFLKLVNQRWIFLRNPPKNLFELTFFLHTENNILKEFKNIRPSHPIHVAFLNEHICGRCPQKALSNCWILTHSKNLENKYLGYFLKFDDISSRWFSVLWSAICTLILIIIAAIFENSVFNDNINSHQVTKW